MNNAAVMRAILWEQAKGSLRAIIATYSDDDGPRHEKYFAEADEVIEDFIKHFEDHGIGGIC